MWMTEKRYRLTGTVFAMALAGCTADVENAMSIVQNQLPETEDGICLVPSTRSMTRWIEGTYDVNLDKDYPYYFYPLVVNNLPKLGDDKQVEVNLIQYEGVEVKIEPPAGITLPSTPNCPTEFTYPEAVLLGPTEERGSRVKVLLECHAHVLRANFRSLLEDVNNPVNFNIAIRAIGRHAGDRIKSDPFNFKIHVCAGCLQRGYTMGFEIYDYPNVPLCTDLAANPYAGNACNPGQDSTILCCARSKDQAGAPVGLECPGRPQSLTAP